jgi:hypothetical protein
MRATYSKKYKNNEESKKTKLVDFFKSYGPWEDTRDSEAIISDIRNSRISKDDIAL